MSTYSFVIPIYNEHETLPELARRMKELMARLDGDAEVILVDDGSTDRSFDGMLALHGQDPRFKLLRLSRNFGHQIAITAGMDHSQGQATIIMDADLQDPPELVLEMARKWREGSEIVYAIRKEREGESWFKRVTAAGFYRLLQKLTDLKMPADVGDFRLVDRRALEAFLSMRETHRYVRGMFSWVGFRQTGVIYKRQARFAGQTKYPFRKMLKLARDAMISFSYAPLRVAMNLGFLVSLGSVLYGLYAIGLKFTGHTITGWTSLAVLISFLGGAQLMVAGILGEYVGRIYEESKRRPLYVVGEARGIEDSTSRSKCQNR